MDAVPTHTGNKTNMKTQPKPERTIKSVYSLVAGLLLLGSANLRAVEPDNKVVLHYKTVTLGYAYSPDYAESNEDLHEANLNVSYDIANFLLGVDVGNGWLTADDLNVFQVHPTLGYIIKPTERIHLIPQVGAQYMRFHDWDYWYADSWNIDATLRLNVAATDRIQVGVFGGYIWNVDAELLGWDAELDDTWTVGVDARFAVTDNFGISPFLTYQEEWEVLRFGVGLTFGF